MKRRTTTTLLLLAIAGVMALSSGYVAHAQATPPQTAPAQTTSSGGLFSTVAGIASGYLSATGHATAAAVVSGTFNLGAGITTNIIRGYVAFLSYLAFSFASWFLSLSGTLLNVGMYLTTHLQIFIDQAPVIYSVWAIIRDLASILLIFFILYAAIQMIIGFEDAHFGNLIKNIVIVGVVINFSFFFTQVLIDTSNIVSLEFYNAIAPTNTASIPSTGNVASVVSSLLTSGGISDTMMSALKVSSWFKDNGQLTSNWLNPGANVDATFQITLITLAGIVVIVLTTLSFEALALACVIRLAVLLFLLCFSPIWIASYAMPKLKPLSEKWVSQFKAQLLFLPVYLAFLYVALDVVTKSGLNNIATANTQGLGGFVNLFVGFSIVIVLLNIPLIAAVQVAGAGSALTEKWMRALSNKTSSFFGSRTIGRAAYSLNESRLMGRFASSQPLLGGLASSGLSSVSNAGFGLKKGGYEDRLKAKKKTEEALHKRLGTVDRGDYATDAEFKEAQEIAKGYQKEYREGLPWKRGLSASGVIGFMVDNRANRQTSAKLVGEANKKAMLKQEKEVRERLKTTQSQISSLESEIEKQANGTGFAPGKPASAEQLGRLKALQEKLGKDEGIMSEIEEYKEEQRTENIAGKIKIPKDEGGGGDGGDKSKKS